MHQVKRLFFYTILMGSLNFSYVQSVEDGYKTPPNIPTKLIENMSKHLIRPVPNQKKSFDVLDGQVSPTNTFEQQNFRAVVSSLTNKKLVGDLKDAENKATSCCAPSLYIIENMSESLIRPVPDRKRSFDVFDGQVSSTNTFDQQIFRTGAFKPAGDLKDAENNETSFCTPIPCKRRVLEMPSAPQQKEISPSSCITSLPFDLTGKLTLPKELKNSMLRATAEEIM